MSLDSASEILLLIVSSVLALFLVVLIIAVVLVIRILTTVKRITAKAEHIADSAESVASFFKGASSASAVTTVVANIIEHVQGKKRGK